MTPVGVFFCWQGGAERDFVNSTTLSQSATVLQLFKQQRELRKGNAHAAHNVHDLTVFCLQLFLLQLLEPGLLFTDFGLDLINLGLNFHAFGSCHFKTSCHGKRP